MAKKTVKNKRKKKMKSRKTGRMGLRFAWGLLILIICAAFGYWVLTILPREQHQAVQVEVETVVPTAVVPIRPPYGFDYYKNEPVLGATATPLYLVMDDLGLHVTLTEQALKELPPKATVAFSPYAQTLPEKMEAASEKGHEVLLQLPLQPLDGADRGPLMITADVTSEQNLKKLEDILKSGKAFIGMIASGRNQVVSSREDILPLLEHLQKEALLFVDASLSARSITAQLSQDLKMPYVAATTFLTNKMTPRILEEELAQVKHALEMKKPVVMVAALSPLVLPTLMAWLAENKALYQLQPLSDSFVQASK